MPRPFARLSDLGTLPAAILALALASGGCSRTLVKAQDPIEIGAGSYARVFAAAGLTLRDEGFVLNRQDYRFGVITTRPMLSGTLLEPWEQTNSTMYQAWESTLNAERRTVTVTLDPLGAVPTTQPGSPGGSGGGLDYRLRVEELIERQEAPERQMTGSTVRITAALSGLPESYTDRAITNSYWMPFTHDPYLEQQLVGAILRRATALDAAGGPGAAPGTPGIPASSQP